ncbi:MAG: polysaccharide deacetylase family protein [Candidatus Eisenbacteria bacterium]
MDRLGFVLSSRGIRNSIARAFQVATRFGVTAARMEKQLGAYADVVSRYGACPSLPITAAVLDRNPRVARGLVDRGVELCVHGLVHNDLSELSPQMQRDQIEQAIAIFKKHDIPFQGFRSPYLRYDGGTLSAVSALEFEYDSNMPFYWEPGSLLEGLVASESDGLRRGLRFYNPVKFPDERSLPRHIDRLVEIPVSLPDDEILLDRMGLPPEKIGDTWEEMARLALDRGELLTIQLHPERIELLRESLSRVLDFAETDGGFWITTMAKIASWWKERTRLEVDVAQTGQGKYRVLTPPGIRSQLEIAIPATGVRVGITPGSEVASPKKPVIGVHPKTGDDLRHKIRDMGYLIETSENNALYACHFAGRDGPDEIDKRIPDLDHPLLVDTFWPRPFKAALTVTGDIDCLTLGDFIRRFREG